MLMGMMTKTMKLCKLHSFSTSPKLSLPFLIQITVNNACLTMFSDWFFTYWRKLNRMQLCFAVKKVNKS